MTEKKDIVDRLRERIVTPDFSPEFFAEITAEREDAADEIEELRDELLNVKALVDAMSNMRVPQ